MPFAAATRTTRRLALPLAALMSALGLLMLAAPSAHAEPAGWGRFVIPPETNVSRNYVGTMTQQAAGFPVATFTSNSVGGTSVGVQTGASTYLSTATEVGAKYGSSQDRGYLNLRPYNQNGAPPSVTTYTFARPTPTSGWTFVLGDIDADQVTVSATGPGGRTVSPAELGFRSVFNYCTRAAICTVNTDVPSWNPATGVLIGNAGALDTFGASAWFEPTVPLTSLTFTYAQRAGFPVYQTWFSALEYNLTGTVTVTDLPQQRENIRVLLFDPAGNQVGSTTTNAVGEYEFEGFATYDGYRVQVVRPTGLTSDDPLTQIVDLSEGDQVADFTLRAIVPVPVSGFVRNNENPAQGVGGVTVTLTAPDGTTRTTVTESDGSYVFERVAVGDGYTVTATPPPGTTVSTLEPFDVPDDSETRITLDDIIVTPIPTGTATGSVREDTDTGPGVSGVRINVVGPEGATYTAFTDDEGNWILPDLPPGDYTATVVAPDGTEIEGARERDFTIRDTGGEVEVDPFVLTVPDPETFSAGGTVTDDDGQPVAGVDVLVTDPVTEQQRTVTTNENGVWTITGLDPAVGYTATVVVPDGYDPVGETTLTFTIDDSAVTRLDFELAAEVTPSPTPTPTPTPTTPTPSPTSASPSPDPTVTETVEVDYGSDSGSSSSSSGSLASTGGPSLLIGLGGVALLLAGLLTLGARRRGRRS